MKALGCVWLFRGMFVFSCHKHWLDILCTRDVYFTFFFFSKSLMWGLFFVFCVWHLPSLGGRLYKKECTFVWRYPSLSACGPVSESMRIRRTTLTDIVFYFALEYSPLMCFLDPHYYSPQLSLFFFFFEDGKIRSRLFVLLCSCHCSDWMEIVFLSYLWDIKGKAPASYQKASLLMLHGLSRDRGRMWM